MTSLFYVEHLDGVETETNKLNSDSRGYFLKMESLGAMSNGINSIAVSCNPIIGTIRGFHFQVEPYAEEKIITCLQGSILDVLLDLRPGSNTFGSWTTLEINTTNRLSVYLPKGIAHGFQTTEENTHVQYCLGAAYSPEHAVTINPFGIEDLDWPIETHVVSDKDLHGISFLEGAKLYRSSIERPG
jgi:dTDP-4-dehydrorhamnose 3,5-epimerase